MTVQAKPAIPAEVWRKGAAIPGYDPNQWRHDANGSVIRFGDYGDRDSKYGWEADHIVPVSSGGSNNLSHLRPLHWHTNAGHVGR